MEREVEGRVMQTLISSLTTERCQEILPKIDK